MKKYFFLIGMFSIGLVFAQDGENLVENGSFESIDKAPKKLGGIESAKGWSSATGNKADLFVKDKRVPEISGESNKYGTETAQDGNNFAGIMAYSKGNKIPRSYITSKLTEPLKKGQSYCVKFYVSLGDNSKFSSNNIGAHFSKKDISIQEKKTIIDKAHVLNPGNGVISAMYGWERVCGTFEAQGGEKFITIGNFSTSEDTKEIKEKQDKNNKNPQILGAYYYIDNISVQLLEAGEKCDCGSDDYEEIGSAMIYSRSSFITENMTLEQKLEANTIYFGFGRDLITGAAAKNLDRLVEWLKANPNAKIKIVAHIDEGEAEVAKTNSIYKGIAMRRANSVIKYLMDKGIDKDRLIEVDKGDRSPAEADGNDEELNQAKSRRVEFVLVK